MIGPTRAQCGVADYTAYLTNALRKYVALGPTIDPVDYRPETDGADIIHVQHQYFLFGGVAPWRNRFAAFVRNLRVPTVLTAHEFVLPNSPPHVRAGIRITNRMQFGLRRIRRIFVHTETDKAHMVSEGFAGSRIEVIRHGVPEPLALTDPSSAKRALGLEGRFVVTLFGFLSRKKGHGIAVEAMREAPDNVSLLFAGGRHPDDRGDYATLVGRMVEESGMTDRIRITGYLSNEEVATVMAATDLIIAPFAETSGSGSLALAFACGKAIVASDVEPLREIVSEDSNVIRLVENRPSVMAAAIRRLMTADDERRELEQGAREYAASHTYDRMARETVAAYVRVLGGDAV